MSGEDPKRKKSISGDSSRRKKSVGGGEEATPAHLLPRSMTLPSNINEYAEKQRTEAREV